MIEIYYTYLSKNNHQKLLDDYLETFSTPFQDRLKNYRRWEDTQLSLLGRLLLRQGLKKYLGHSKYELTYNEFNKPILSSEYGIHFNISHSGQLAICAIFRDSDIGIDIEQINPINLNDFKSNLTKKEWHDILNAENSQHAFYTYWTQKEAVIKALGKGLFIPLNCFEVIDNCAELDGEKYFLKEISIEEIYKCQIACKVSPDDILIEVYEKKFS